MIQFLVKSAIFLSKTLQSGGLENLVKLENDTVTVLVYTNSNNHTIKREENIYNTNIINTVIASEVASEVTSEATAEEGVHPKTRKVNKSSSLLKNQLYTIQIDPKNKLCSLVLLKNKKEVERHPFSRYYILKIIEWIKKN